MFLSVRNCLACTGIFGCFLTVAVTLPLCQPLLYSLTQQENSCVTGMFQERAFSIVAWLIGRGQRSFSPKNPRHGFASLLSKDLSQWFRDFSKALLL